MTDYEVTIFGSHAWLVTWDGQRVSSGRATNLERAKQAADRAIQTAEVRCANERIVESYTVSKGAA